MNYLQNKKYIMMVILINLSVISSISHVNASNCCFPKGKELFLDATSIPNWYSDYVYQYVYMYGDNGWNTWIKLSKQYCNSKYFSWKVPQGGYYGIVFSCNNCDLGSFETCNQQTIDIYYDNNNNCYTFNGKYNKRKVLGNWKSIDLYQHYYPVGKTIFLDITNVKNWNNPYMYMFGPCGVDSWVKMDKYIGGGRNNILPVLSPKVTTMD